MGMPGKRMRLGTKSCSECRRRKVRCIFPPGRDRCDACRTHDSSCVPQEKQPRDDSGDAAPPASGGGDDEVAALKKRLDELEALMRGLPRDMLSRQSDAQAAAAAAGLTDGSSAAAASDSPSSAAGASQQQDILAFPSLISTAQISPALRNSPLLGLFNASSIFDRVEFADAAAAAAPAPAAPALTPSASEQLRRCLADFAPYLPRPERVAAFFTATQQHWPVWPPYFHGPGDAAERLAPGQVALAERTFHEALVSGRPGATAKAVLFLALCIQQTPKHRLLPLLPPSVRQRDLVDAYAETARALLQLDEEEEEEEASTLDGVEAMNMLCKLCTNAGRPLRAWSWHRRAVTAALRCGLPGRGEQQQPRAAQAWCLAWQAERYMAMTLGLPSSTSAAHPGLQPPPPPPPPPGGAPSPVVAATMHYLADVCGRIIDRDQGASGPVGSAAHHAATLRLGAELASARLRLFPALDATISSEELDTTTTAAAAAAAAAANWFRQSTKIIFLTAVQHVHLPYLLRSAATAADDSDSPNRDAALCAARETCEAYRDFRHRGGAEMCEVTDFWAFSAALVLVLAGGGGGTEEEDLVRETVMCLQRTARVMECRVAEQAARVLEALEAARRGVAYTEYEVVVPYFGRIRIRKGGTGGGPEKAGSFNTIELSTRDVLADFQFDAAEELCGEWTELAWAYAPTDWSQSFTYGPFFGFQG